MVNFTIFPIFAIKFQLLTLIHRIIDSDLPLYMLNRSDFEEIENDLEHCAENENVDLRVDQN